MTTPTPRQRRRRSLLRGVGAGDRQRGIPLWRALVVANGLVVGLSLAVQLIELRTLEYFPQITLVTVTFCTPITILAHFTTRLVARVNSRVPRALLLASAWLVCGVLGSLLAYVALRSIGGNTFASFNVEQAFPIGNGIIAVGVGATIFFVELMRGHYRQRSTLLREQDMLTAELQAARNVQQSLLPERDLHLAGFDISGITEPAVEIGGDYFDYLTFADGTKGIIVADAAGKGVPAALVMAKFQGMAQALSIHVKSAAEFFIGLNDTLTLRLDRRSFITVGMLTIDFDDRCVFYRAGHNPLVIFRAATETTEQLRPAGMALGLTHGPFGKFPFAAAPFEMASGDIALLYSDGLTEATDPDGVEFGDERTIEVLTRAGVLGLSAAAAREAIVQCLGDFVRSAEPHDDVTLVVVRKV